MEVIKNLNNKRICDRSEDGRVVQIVHKDCMTLITANPDGTLNIKNIRIPKIAYTSEGICQNALDGRAGSMVSLWRQRSQPAVFLLLKIF